MTKIVIDSNVFMSALISNRGASHRVVTRFFEDESIINLISTPTVIELKDVLMRAENMKLYAEFSQEDILSYICDICAISENVKINYLWRPFLKDYGDDKILEVAFNGGASAIVTHNIRDFKSVYEKFDIRVVTPQQYLKDEI